MLCSNKHSLEMLTGFTGGVSLYYYRETKETPVTMVTVHKDSESYSPKIEWLKFDLILYTFSSESKLNQNQLLKLTLFNTTTLNTHTV